MAGLPGTCARLQVRVSPHATKYIRTKYILNECHLFMTTLPPYHSASQKKVQVTALGAAAMKPEGYKETLRIGSYRIKDTAGF